MIGCTDKDRRNIQIQAEAHRLQEWRGERQKGKYFFSFIQSTSEIQMFRFKSMSKAEQSIVWFILFGFWFFGSFFYV